MKRFNNFKKAVAALLAAMVFLSSFSVLSIYAADYSKLAAGHNAQTIEVGATKDQVLTGASNKYSVSSSNSWGLKWVKELKYTNAVTGDKETLFANQAVNFHQIGSSKTTVWCIEPYRCIYNDGNYMSVDEGGNTKYWNALQKKPEIKNAIAKTVAYGKANGANSNNEFYFAVQLISWEFIFNRRDPSTYSLKKASDGNTYAKLCNKFVSCSTTEKKNKLLNAYDLIISEMKSESDMPKSFFKTIDGAKASKDDNKFLMPEEPNKSGVYSTTINFASRGDDLTAYDLSYKIVTKNDGAPQSNKNFKVSVKDSKITVSTTANLYELAKSDNHYFLKLTKNINATNSTSDDVFQNKKEDSQTLSSKMKYTKPTVVRYYHIKGKIPPTPTPPTTITTAPIPKYGSLQVEKNIVPDSGEVYTGDYSGWCFLYTNVSAKSTAVLTTNAEGKTDKISKIPLGSHVTIKELGRKIQNTDNVNDFTAVQTVSGVKYGMPKYFKDKTELYDGNITSEENLTVGWENSYSKPFPVKIIKSVDDNTTVQGYYFLVYSPTNRLMSDIRIVGPTDENGEVSFLLDKAIMGDVIAVVELGFLKPGHSYSPVVSINDFLSDKFRNDFEIPSRYRKQTGTSAITGKSDGIPFALNGVDIRSGSKEILFDNITFGRIKIHKTNSITSDPVPGAVYGVFAKTQPNEEGSAQAIDMDNLVCKLPGTDKDGYAVSDSIRTGEYYIQEISCPETFYLDPTKYDITIKPGTDTEMTATVIPVIDKPTRIIITKRETSTLSTNNQPIPNCVIEIYEKTSKSAIDYSKAKPIYTYKTTLKSESIVGLLKVGHTYVVHEKSCPSGYCLADDIEFTVNTDGKANSITMTDETTKFDFSKRKLTGTDEFPGNLMALKEKGASKNLREWTSTTKPYRLEGVLEVGKTYVFTERKPVDGYTTAESVEFTVENDGSLKTKVMENAPTKIQPNKVDTKKKPVAGATLQIQDSVGNPVKVRDYDGNLVESWVSRTTPLTIEGILAINETYKLVELKSPAGYTVAKPVSFTVQDITTVQIVSMTDDTTKFDFSKRKLTGTDEFPGNLMALKEKGASKNLREWTSTTKPYRLEGVLEVGKTYVLIERKPVDGYTTAESVEFTVENDGSLKTKVMKNAPTKIQPNKVDTKKKPVAGATLQIQDSAGNPVKVRDYDGNLVESWVSRTTPLTIEGILAINKTYKLVELKSPAGYTVAKPVSFTVQDISTVQIVPMTDDTTKVEFAKLAGDTNKQLSDCVLSLENSKGKEILRWTTTNKPYYLEGVLEAGETYTLKEISAKEGYMKAAPITFKVRTDGKKQTVTMTDLKYTRPELPKTGGNGIFPYAIVGTSLFVCATMVYLIKRRLKG